MNTAYQQFGRVSGVSMVYVPEHSADGTDTGMEGDVSIGGENIDGTSGGALADNTLPNDGDMRIDTTRESDGRPTFWHTNEAARRNLMIHETGHGVELGHAQNTGVAAVMEGGCAPTFGDCSSTTSTPSIGNMATRSNETAAITARRRQRRWAT